MSFSLRRKAPIHSFLRSFIVHPSIHLSIHSLIYYPLHDETTLQSRHMPLRVIVSRTIYFNVVTLLEARLQASSSTLIRMVLPEEL